MYSQSLIGILSYKDIVVHFLYSEPQMQWQTVLLFCLQCWKRVLSTIFFVPFSDVVTAVRCGRSCFIAIIVVVVVLIFILFVVTIIVTIVALTKRGGRRRKRRITKRSRKTK